MPRLLLLFAAFAAAAACGNHPVAALTIATTTSVGNSGLLDVLARAYLDGRGTRVQAHLVGSGRALDMLASGTVDLVITHSPAAEAAALARHPQWSYRKIMYNDFVLAGPTADPAGARGAADVVEAMRRIASSSSRFISRGDESGTHERERDLWTRAGTTPGGGRLVVAGAGMGATLRVANEAEAYTLTDRATFEQHASSLAMRIVFEGGPLLLNTYAVIADPSGPREGEARAFGEWLASGGGRDLIAGYRGAAPSPLFRVWPVDRPATRPADVPLGDARPPDR